VTDTCKFFRKVSDDSAARDHCSNSDDNHWVPWQWLQMWSGVFNYLDRYYVKHNSLARTLDSGKSKVSR
jgi:hypothetical protein